MVIGAYVLAGGRSQRMGEDKAIMPVHGTPMAARTASILEASGCGPVHLVGRQSQLNALKWPVVTDIQTGIHHPLLGIASGLQHAGSGRALFAPCDLLGLTVAHIHALIDANECCVASIDGRVHPLLSVLDATMHTSAFEHASEGRSAMNFVQSLRIIELPPPTPRDANYPRDITR